MGSEQRWIVAGILMVSGLVCLYLTVDVPYLMFMRRSIEQSIDHKINVLHLACAGVMIVICIMYSVVVIFAYKKDPDSPALGTGVSKGIFPFVFIGFLILLHFIFTVVASAKLGSDEKTRLKYNVDNYWKYDNNSPQQRFVDEIQVNLKCCGTTSVSDYSSNEIPPSCCDNKSCDKERAHTSGCYGSLSTLLTSQSTLPIVTAGVCLMFIVLNVAGILRFAYGRRRARQCRQESEFTKPLLGH